MFQLPHDSFSLRNSFLLATAGTVAVGRSASYYTKLQSLRTLARPATSTGDGRTSHLPILLFLDLRCFSRLSFDVVLACLVCRVPLVLLLVLRQWPRVAFWMRRAGPFALPCARTRGNQKSPPTSPLLRLTRSVGTLAHKDTVCHAANTIAHVGFARSVSLPPNCIAVPVDFPIVIPQGCFVRGMTARLPAISILLPPPKGSSSY